jgi:hypothetical protein
MGMTSTQKKTVVFAAIPALAAVEVILDLGIERDSKGSLARWN